MKTAERAHTPKNLWEKTKLPANYSKALELVSEKLEHFPKYLVHRNKQRLTKIHQMLIRMRKIKLKGGSKLQSINTNRDKMETRKERKALIAARLEREIEKELLERLSQAKDSGGVFNYPEKAYAGALKTASKQYSKESNEKNDDEEEEEEEEEFDEEFDEEYEEEYEVDEEEEEIEEIEEKVRAVAERNSSAGKKGSKRKVEIEYEEDLEDSDRRILARN